MPSLNFNKNILNITAPGCTDGFNFIVTASDLTVGQTYILDATVDFGDVFFDRSGNYLLCTSHGAHFHPDDGYCTRGPCRGKSLRRFPIKVADNNIVVAEEE